MKMMNIKSTVSAVIFGIATAALSLAAQAAGSYFPQTDIEPEYYGRNGTSAEKAFVIRKAADFVALKSMVENEEPTTNVFFEVVADGIELEDWQGIGSSGAPFRGVLNGNGNTVSITFCAGANYNGLFRTVDGATISNMTVNVLGFTGIEGETAAAGFVGNVYGECTFSALKTTGSIGTETEFASHTSAGIAVRVLSVGAQFIDCTNAATIYAACDNTKIGGIVGMTFAEASFTRCVNEATLVGDISEEFIGEGYVNGVGGIVGLNGSTAIFEECVNRGELYDIDGTNSVQIGQFSGGNLATSSAVSPIVGVGYNVGLTDIAPKGPNPINGMVLPYPDFTFATIDGDAATFVVEPVTNVETAIEYKAMIADNSKFTFTLASPNASLTIITNMCGFSGTVAMDESLESKYQLVEDAAEDSVTYSLASIEPPPADKPAKGDVDGNDISDVMFQYTGGDNQIGYWMNGTATWQGTGVLQPSEWDLLTSRDMNADGYADAVMLGNVMFGSTKGAYVGFYSAGDTATGWVNIGFLDNSEDIDWKLAVGNLTGNEDKNSIVWYAPELGAVGAWIDGTSEWVDLGSGYNDTWVMAGCGDFNGDYCDEVLFTHDNGLYTVDINKNFTILGDLATGWEVRAIGDFTGDGKDDIVVFYTNDDPTVAQGFVARLENGDPTQFTYLGQLAASDWFVVGAGDYDGDGIDDLLVRQYSTGMLGYYQGGDMSKWVEMGRGVDMNWTVVP